MKYLAAIHSLQGHGSPQCHHTAWGSMLDRHLSSSETQGGVFMSCTATFYIMSNRYIWRHATIGAEVMAPMLQYCNDNTKITNEDID